MALARLAVVCMLLMTIVLGCPGATISANKGGSREKPVCDCTAPNTQPATTKGKKSKGNPRTSNATEMHPEIKAFFITQVFGHRSPAQPTGMATRSPVIPLADSTVPTKVFVPPSIRRYASNNAPSVTETKSTLKKCEIKRSLTGSGHRRSTLHLSKTALSWETAGSEVSL